MQAVTPVEQPSRLCRQCRYILDGLPLDRCPECGTTFDPRDPSTYALPRSATPLAAGIALAGRLALCPPVIAPLVWASLLFRVLWWIALPMTLLSLLRSVRRRRWQVAYTTMLLSLAPFLVPFAHGVGDYLLGREQPPYRSSWGLNNVDRGYRCHWRSAGCMVTDLHTVSTTAYNDALRFMIDTFGPMRGSYVGYYPTRDEALAALHQAETVDLDALIQDRVVTPSTTVQLQPGVGVRVMRGTMWNWAIAKGDEYAFLRPQLAPITATVYAGCLILCVPDGPPTGSSVEPAANIVLVDSTRGRPFAYYQREGWSVLTVPIRWPETPGTGTGGAVEPTPREERACDESG